jgi:hypothetical protein
MKSLKEIAYARSGDKGSHVNIGLIAKKPEDYPFLLSYLTAEKVKLYFAELNPKEVIRYELPNLHALNFVLKDVLDGGASLNLRIDAQGKALGQALLSLCVESYE